MKLGIPVVHGSIFRFEGQVTVFEPYERPVLPLPAARAAARRAGAELRRGRRARRAARHHRLDPGARGDQAPPRHRRPAHRAATSPSTRSTWSSASTSCSKDPTNQITWENRDQIQVAEMEGLCQPSPLQAPAAA